MRSPRSSESSSRKETAGAWRRRRLWNRARRKKPAALLSAFREASRAGRSPRTLTYTRTLRRSGLTVAPVMVTKPILGSRTSRRSRRETSVLIRSETLSCRVLTGRLGSGLAQVLHVAAEDLAGDASLQLPLDRREGLLQRDPCRGDPDDRQRGPLPQILVVDLRHRDVVVLAQAVLQAAQDLPLLLQRGHSRQVHLDDAERDVDAGVRVVGWAHRSEALDRDLERLDHVAGLQIVVAGEADAALVPGLDLAGVVLEPPQGGDLAGVDHDVVAQEAHLRGAGDPPVAHQTPGHRSYLGDLEDLADLRAAQVDLLRLGLEEADHRVADLVGNVVDDRVQPEVDLLLLGQLLRAALGTDVETYDDGVA